MSLGRTGDNGEHTITRAEWLALTKNADAPLTQTWTTEREDVQVVSSVEIHQAIDGGRS